jgi:20S proteasome alpha/beta subunit
MQADAKALHKVLQMRNIMYQHDHSKPMSVSAVAQLLSNTLYYKRFFPYYTFNIVAGLDDAGKIAGTMSFTPFNWSYEYAASVLLNDKNLRHHFFGSFA